MLLPVTLLLLLSLAAGNAAGRLAWDAAPGFMHPGSTPPIVPMPDGGASWPHWLSVGLALALAVFNLSRRKLPQWLVGSLDRVLDPPLDGLRVLHSGMVGDYAMWIMVGLALFTAAFAAT